MVHTLSTCTFFSVLESENMTGLALVLICFNIFQVLIQHFFFNNIKAQSFLSLKLKINSDCALVVPVVNIDIYNFLCSSSFKSVFSTTNLKESNIYKKYKLVRSAMLNSSA